MIEDKIEQMAIRHPLLIELIILVLLPIGLFFTYIWVFFEFLSSFFKRKSDIYEPQTIVITGASSGIGAALALEYAQPGKRLGLLARNETRLNQVASQCRSKGAVVDCMLVDMKDTSKLETKLKDYDTNHTVDLIIANAGINGMSTHQKSLDELLETDFISTVKPIIQVNYVGTVSSIHPLISRFVNRRSGQIAIVSSGMGIQYFPISPSYSSSKAGLNFLALAMRPVLKRFNVKMNLICPGFVETNMVANMKTMGSIKADLAAKLIRDGLRYDRELISFPLSTYLSLRLLSSLPEKLKQQLVTALWKYGFLPSDDVCQYNHPGFQGISKDE